MFSFKPFSPYGNGLRNEWMRVDELQARSKVEFSSSHSYLTKAKAL